MVVSVRRWDPVRDLLSIQNEMTRLFGRALGGSGEEGEVQGGWAPEIDVRHSNDRFTVFAELPGLTADEVEITVEDGVLSISGERKFYPGEPEDSFLRVERRYGRFARRIALPPHSDAGRIEASMSNGVLRIDVPKSEEAKPKRIEVRAQG